MHDLGNKHLTSEELQQGFETLTIKELRSFKEYLIGEIKYYQRATRMIDKLIKEKLQ